MKSVFLRGNKGQGDCIFDLQKILMIIFQRSDLPFVIFEVDNKLYPTVIIDVNKAFCEKLGYEREELLSKNFMNIYGGPVDKFENINNSCEVTDKTIITRQYLLNKNRVKIPFEIHQHNTGIKGAGIGAAMLIDISEQLDYQSKLSESEECCRRIVEYSPDAILICDSNMIKYANKSAAGFLGKKDAKEIIDKPLCLFVYTDYYEKVINQIKYVMDKKEQVPTFETKFIRNDGFEFYISSSANYIIYNGTPSVQIIVRDITEKKETRV